MDRKIEWYIMAKGRLNLTQSRCSLLEDMIMHGPMSYESLHWSWLKDLRKLEQHGLVAHKNGLWLITPDGRLIFKRRGYGVRLP